MMKVERVTADVIVAEQLKKWIIEKNLQPGDRLPTEQVLSEELGVAAHPARGHQAVVAAWDCEQQNRLWSVYLRR